VLRTSVISTLFPHLPRRHAHVFREMLVAGLLIVVLLGALRLYAPALLAAALLLPVLYLFYLYEVEVYEAQPWRVLLATFGTGAVLGVGYSLGFGHLVHPTVNGTNEGPIFSAVLLPIVGQVLMLMGPLLLLSRSGFDEVLDGLSFGVSSALGFTVASVISGYWHTLTAPLLGSGSISSDEIASVVRAAILAALVNAATTSTITASVWLARNGRSRKWHVHLLLGLPSALAIAFGSQLVLGVVNYYVTSLLLVVVLWAIAAASLLVWVRICLHNSLLEEGAERNIGEPSACSECHRLVPYMLFCPACGVARSAGPKRVRPPTDPPDGPGSGPPPAAPDGPADAHPSVEPVAP
jgi:RsiW-degrading membrane proteinase PrsW (M82 family)